MTTFKYILGLPLLLLYAFYFSNSKSTRGFSTEKEYLTIEKVIQKKTDLQKSIEKGKEVYADFCIQCHMANGKGDLKNFPPLDGSNWLIKNINQSIHAVKFGQTGEILVNGKKFNNTMPSMGLSNQEVADVMNYIRNSWSNKQQKMISLKQVEAIKQ
ncbi:c-type cytochrome [Flavobacterium cellulosilyticum]|uniref:Cytochrome c n=1 Tax=Flavobacterium cellulosilyticum TaxID=2541731 RepID=A0A4R5CIW5_9FLAO|nr:cytochrome c [Flavobacterium cellulosilyticum]TDD99745.1 cytochrome c [Flavobacterium cellulosilyticum]